VRTLQVVWFVVVAEKLEQLPPVCGEARSGT
jgi:hypothetical protein